MLERPNRRLGDLKPDAEMWEALDQGERLTAILQDFYSLVYMDPRLSPFFDGVTRQRAIEKQYSFLRRIFTGEDVYFGDRPSNAHHWMVISDELFNHREALMEGCLRRHGLADSLIERWRGVEEIFRKVIVKTQPRPRKIRGEELPLDGYGAIAMAVGTLCDGCFGPINVGTWAMYHTRTGRTYCASCMPGALPPSAVVG
jgi:truncated hemoglobin YjbI